WNATESEAYVMEPRSSSRPPTRMGPTQPPMPLTALPHSIPPSSGASALSDAPGWTSGGFKLIPMTLLGLPALLLLLLLTVPAELRTAVSESGQLLGYLVAMGCCAYVAARSPRGRGQFAWLWIALAFASNVVAEGIYGFIVLVLHQPAPFPSLADAFY